MMRSLSKDWFTRFPGRQIAPGRRRTTFSNACLLAGCMAFSIGMGGCKDNANNAAGTGTAGVTGDKILVGEFASMTGGTSTFGIATHEGIQLAIDEANAAGGVSGKQIELKTEDDRSKPEDATTVVTKLVTQDNVAAVLGEVSSTRSMNGAAVCQPNKTPMITPSSTNPEVTKKGDYIFRVCFTDDFQAAVAATFAKDQGYKKVAIFKDIKNDYSVGFAKFFTEVFTKNGGAISGEQTYQEGDQDFKAQLNSIKATNPDAILVPGYYSEVGTIARQAREIGLNVPLIGGDGWDSPQLIPGAGTALENCFFTDHSFSVDATETEAKAFVEAYRKKYNKDPDALTALGYDAAKILIEAMKNAKTLDRTGIRDALAQIKDFPGVTGRITIDANRNARKAAVVMQVKGDKFGIFKTYTPEQVGL